MKQFRCHKCYPVSKERLASCASHLETFGDVTFLYLFVSGDDFSGTPHNLTQDLLFAFK